MKIKVLKLLSPAQTCKKKNPKRKHMWDHKSCAVGQTLPEQPEDSCHKISTHNPYKSSPVAEGGEYSVISALRFEKNHCQLQRMEEQTWSSSTREHEELWLTKRAWGPLKSPVLAWHLGLRLFDTRKHFKEDSPKTDCQCNKKQSG